MDKAFTEITRVMRPGGRAYISEPVYAGDFNEILRLFNDEKAVRKAAFAATVRAVGNGLLRLEQEIHFHGISRFQGFEEFEQRVLGATHSEFDVDKGFQPRSRPVSRRISAPTGSPSSSILCGSTCYASPDRAVNDISTRRLPGRSEP